MKGTWSIFRLLLVAKTYHKSVPSTGIRWRWQQVFPTKPSQVQSHCVAGRLLSKPSKPLFLAFSRHASRPPGEVGFPGACLEYPKASPWALQSWIPILGLHLFQSETTQLSVQVTGVGGE